MRHPHSLAIPALCVALSLAACGGGGGGGGTTAAARSTVEVALTSDNMEQAGSAAVTAAEVGSVPPTDLGDLVVGARTGGAGPNGSAIRAVLVDQLQALADLPPADVASGITLTRSEDCEFGGSVAVTITDGNGSIDSGDALDASFTDCDGGEGVVNGRLSLVLLSFSGDFSPSGSATADASFTDLQVSDGSGSVTANGNMQISLTQSDSSREAEYLASGMRYDLSGPSRSGSITTSDGEVTVIETLDGSTTTLGETIGATLPNFSGTLLVATLQPIVRDAGGEIVSGQIHLSGSKGVVRLTFLGGGQVLLELDAEGDGSFEISRALPLAELESVAF